MDRTPFRRRAARRAPASLLSLLCAALLPSAGLAAQDPDPGEPAADTVREVPRFLTPDEYGRFERLGRTTLSPDGRWLAVEIRRVDEENELRLRPVADPDSVVVIPFGTNGAFSDDGRWFGALEGVSDDERERMRKAETPARSTLVLMDLAAGDTTRIDEVAGFSFSADSRHAALRKYAPEGSREFDGVDVVVRELATGTPTLLGNVGEHAWADTGAWLAVVVDAQGKAGNGLQLFDAASGRLRTLESMEARYSGLTWREDATDLAVMRQIDREADGEDAWLDTAQVAVAFTAVERTTPTKHVVGPEDLPEGMRIPPFGSLRWDDESGVLLMGLDPREPKPACAADAEDEETGGAGDEPGVEPAAGADPVRDEDPACAEAPDDDDRPTVEIWHAADVDIVPTQKVQQGRDRRETRLAAWHLDEGRVVVLQDERLESVSPVEGTRVAVGTDGTPYDRRRMFGPAFEDVWVVDMATGERELVLEEQEFFYGASPTGRYLLFYDGRDWFSRDTRTDATVNLTSELGVSFTNESVDVVVDRKPPYGNGGWMDDDEAVLLYDEFDVWAVAPDGSDAERITEGRGDGIRHRRVYLDFDDLTVDPGAPLYFSLYSDATEEWGYGRASRPGREVETLVYGPRRYTGLSKADDAEVYMYQVQSFEDSPDVFVGGARLADATRVTHTNPFQDEYHWGRAELVEFTNTWGDTLQGSLYYPAGYVEGERYPMIVYIYEIRAQDVRSYQVASERDYYDFQAWVQNGYFVFQPDIVYRDRDPGVSAKAALEPAVARVVETGMVDPDRVGLIGHSWGGYQTTYMSTVSDVFAAAVAGAPLTNLFSMYLSVYWNSGGTDARIFEISQGRMEVPFWEDEEAYRRNSPVFNIESMTTPLLMAQGTEDGAVDFNQGVEFYNAARRADKDFVFLVYNGENHGFAQEPNQRDYHRRIIEWFGHYLKGEPAPEWITAGVPYLQQLETAKGSR